MRRSILVIAALPLLSGGCVAKAAWNVATLPVRATAGAVDVLTVSEKERDEKWVRQQRKAEEARDKAARKQAKDDRKHGYDRDL